MIEAEGPPRIDELLDKAFEAFGAGDRATANVLAEQVLALDWGNTEAEDLLAAPVDSGEIRRLTIIFVDLVDSTELSTKVDPEVYRTVVGRYRDDVVRIVRRYDGHAGSTKGDGLLACFGHPRAHEDDVVRAVHTGIEITRAVSDLSERVRRRFGFDINVRVGIHRGVVYLDTAQDDVYGLAANLAARICSIAQPGTVSVSDAIEPLIRGRFDLEVRPPQFVKGLSTPVSHFRVIAERDLSPIPRGPLVGRRREVDHLEQCWAAAVSSQLQTPGVILQGEAGIGKSRLAWSVVDAAQRERANVLLLTGSPFHTDVGLRPFRRLLERQSGISRTSDPVERLRCLTHEVAARGLEVSRMVAILAPVLGIEPNTGYTAVPAEGRKLYSLIADAVHEYLQACLRGSPALILAEDVHWFDEDTVEVMQALLSSDLGNHTMVIMTSRTPVSLIDDARATVFELRPLSKSESNQLILALDPTMSADAQLQVRRRCDGVPLYIEEVVAKLKNQSGDGASAAGVPDSLYEALFARLRSSTEATQVVEAAAILGTRVERNLLLAAVELDEHALDDVIRQMVDGQILAPVEEDCWRFRHELLRDVAAEISPPSHRRRFHGKIADALSAAAATGNPDWTLIAHHYHRAERYIEASTSYAQASAGAWHRGALIEAQNYLTAAIDQINLAIDDPARDQLEVGLRLRRALLIQAAEGVASPNAATDFERCLNLCDNDLKDDQLFATVMSLYPYYAMRADLDRTERLVKSIRSSLTGPRAQFMPINDVALGMLAWYRGDFGPARSKFDLAAVTLTESAERELESLLFMPNDASAGLFTHRAMSRCLDGDLDGAEADLTRADTRSAALPFPKGAFSQCYSKQLEVLIRLEAGQVDTAARVAADLASLGQQHGFDSWAMVGAAQHASASSLQAMSAGASPAELTPYIGVITAFVDACRMMGCIALITFYDAVIARLLIATGALEEARHRLQVGLDVADATGMHFYDAELLRLRARTTRGAELQRKDVMCAYELARRQDCRLFELRSAIDLFELDGPSSSEFLTSAVSRFKGGDLWPELSRARALMT